MQKGNENKNWNGTNAPIFQFQTVRVQSVFKRKTGSFLSPYKGKRDKGKSKEQKEKQLSHKKIFIKEMIKIINIRIDTFSVKYCFKHSTTKLTS